MSGLSLQELGRRLYKGLYDESALKAILSQMKAFPSQTNNKKKLLIEKYLEEKGVATREELIAQGIIKPANKELTSAEHDAMSENADIGITDLDVAKKYLQLAESASRRGKDFTLKLNDVKALLKRKTCYYTGVKFSLDNQNLRRTVDRKDHTLGYVKGNVVACTHMANQLKEMLLENNLAPFKDNIQGLKKFINNL